MDANSDDWILKHTSNYEVKGKFLANCIRNIWRFTWKNYEYVYFISSIIIKEKHTDSHKMCISIKLPGEYI